MITTERICDCQRSLPFGILQQLANPFLFSLVSNNGRLTTLVLSVIGYCAHPVPATRVPAMSLSHHFTNGTNGCYCAVPQNAPDHRIIHTRFRFDAKPLRKSTPSWLPASKF